MDILEGYVESIVFQNEANGYIVFNLIVEGEGVVCVGMAKGISRGETLELRGTYVEHREYGKQFKVEQLKVVPPKDVESILRYLSSGAIRGIGEALAKRIVKKFGKDTFRIMEQEPEKLVQIKGISERIAREIAGQMEEKRDLRAAMVYLQQYGITNALAVKVYETYKEKIYRVIEENPYLLAEDVAGVGFKMADEIAAKVGIHTDSDYRIASGILYVLLQASQDGHTYLPKVMLLDKVTKLLGINGELIEPLLLNLAMDKKIVIKVIEDENYIYHTKNYYLELKCARLLQDLHGPVGDNISMQKTSIAEEQVRALAQNLEMEMDEIQIKAVIECIKNGLMILSGGPGTGKTTTINMIIHYFEREGLEILLAAPTGRAAKRMKEATNHEAKTIHRLLELSGMADLKKTSFERNADNPLEADVVIIDEMSMVDIYLFHSLLEAVNPSTRLILVGDANQLPSVGPGQVLKDLIQCDCFPVTILKKIFRQAIESDIIVNAHKINKGEEIYLGNKSKDFFFLERSYPEVIYKHMIELIQKKLPKYVNAKPEEIQVLTPMRKGSLGVEQLNIILQKYLNPPMSSKKEILVGAILFREGDKIMQTKNNYQLTWEIIGKYNITVDKGVGVFNGDVGKIIEIREHSSEVLIEFEENKQVVYSFALLEELDLAYAVTIHKSQGSEYPAVIMPLLGGPRMLLNRNLLYTGVTRAKKCVTILGDKNVIKTMINNESQAKRFTTLDIRIKECYGVYHNGIGV